MNYLSSSYKIIKYSPTYKPGVIDLLSSMWSEYDNTGRNELFKWRYEQNPYKEPVIFLALDKELVIGFRSFISQIFLREDKEFLVFSPADTIIHPDYRRKGIISALNEKCTEELNKLHKAQNTILINTSTSKPSMPVYLKQQWQKSNGLRRFYFKFPVNHFLGSLNGSNKNKPSDALIISQKGYKVEISGKIKSKELADFNVRIRNPKKWTNIRDEKFFNWRYNFEPERYTCIYYYEKQLEGYVILKKTVGPKFSIDQYEAKSLKVFRVMLKSALNKLSVSQIRSYAFLPEEKKLLMRTGFVPEPVFILKKLGHLRFPVLVRPIVPSPEQNDFYMDGQDIRDINNWHLQIADRH